MKHRKRDVIAAKRNNKKVLVYIPEKVRRSGKRYVQQYKLIAMRPYAEPMIVSINDSVFIYANISSTSITISAPFSAGLLKTYMDLVATTMKETAHTAFEIGQPGRKDERESWDADYLSGYASITPV